MWLWSFLVAGGKKKHTPFLPVSLSKEKTRSIRQLSEGAYCRDAEDSQQSPQSLSIDSEDPQPMSFQSLILSTNIAFTSKSIKHYFVHSNYFPRIVPEIRSIWYDFGSQGWGSVIFLGASNGGFGEGPYRQLSVSRKLETLPVLILSCVFPHAYKDWICSLYPILFCCPAKTPQLRATYRKECVSRRMVLLWQGSMAARVRFVGWRRTARAHILN